MTKHFDPLMAALDAVTSGMVATGEALLGEDEVGYLDGLLLDERKLVRVLPAAELGKIDSIHLRSWLQHRAIYALPSVELIDWLKAKIGGRSAIEIGSGNGAVARALGIPGTDNFCQTWPDVADYYALTHQPTVNYGPGVEKLAALDAIKKHKPKVVVACWVTHLFREDEPERRGNMYGVDEDAVIGSVECYVHVGATTAHAQKRALKRPHEELRPDWLFSRSAPQNRVIWTWGK